MKVQIILLIPFKLNVSEQFLEKNKAECYFECLRTNEK